MNRKYELYNIGVRKKPKNQLNRENRKKITEKTKPWKKNQLNRLEFWKNRLVRFRFYKSGTEPNKTSQTRKNPAKPVSTGFCSKKLNRTETGRFEPVLVFLKKEIWFGYFFL